MTRINGIEIVNGDAAEGELAGWPFWAKMLNAGFHLTAIGGSDEHTADEKLDRAIGVPTTIVYAEKLSEPAIIEGLRKGRAYVRTRGSEGPAITFEASAGANRWQMGDTIPNTYRELTLSVEMSRCANQVLQWIRNGEVVFTSSTDDGPRASFPVQRVRAGEWFSVILRDDKGPTLFSNAIYVSK